MNTPTLISFLQNELNLQASEIQLALEHCEEPATLPMVLWQYGMVSLNQLDQIFDWMFSSSTTV
jgi:hypothetical protein